MSLALDATAQARIVAHVRGVAWLVELEFTSGTVRYTTAPLNIVVGANTFTAFGTLVDVSPVSESESTGAEQITLGFTAVNTSMLSAVLGNVEGYRGKPARLYLQLLDETWQPAGAPVLRWAGTMQPVHVKRTRSDPTGGASAGRIELPCTRSGMARARNAQGLRLNHAQQLQRFPGDMGLEYVQELIEKPSLWLSKRFQKI